MRIFVLTGAGLSAESGLGTFRDAVGLWKRFDPVKLATPEAFAARPEEVHEFYNMRRQGVLNAEPNAAHFALANLQKDVTARGGAVHLCTQNVDDLLERAGATQVHHMHGELLKSVCAICGAVAPCIRPLSVEDVCTSCRRSGGLRPRVVWFGETPLGLGAIDDWIESSDIFVSIGTSGSVYPAAGLVQTAKVMGLTTYELNLEASDNAHLFDDAIYGPASEVVPKFVDKCLASLT